MAKKKEKLIGSAPTLERLKLLCENYFYSALEFQPNGEVWLLKNSKGILEGYEIRLRKDRYQLILFLEEV